MNGCRAKFANRPDALCKHLLPKVRNALETVLQIVLYAGLGLEARCDDHHGVPGQAGEGSEQTSQRSRVVAEVVEDCAEFSRHVPVHAVGVRAHELRRRNESSVRKVAFHVPYFITTLVLVGVNRTRGGSVGPSWESDSGGGERPAPPGPSDSGAGGSDPSFLRRLVPSFR